MDLWLWYYNFMFIILFEASPLIIEDLLTKAIFESSESMELFKEKLNEISLYVTLNYPPQLTLLRYLKYITSNFNLKFIANLLE